MATAAPSREMVGALGLYELAAMRLNAVKNRVATEGLTPEVTDAWLEAQRDLTFAVCEIDRARQAVTS